MIVYKRNNISSYHKCKQLFCNPNKMFTFTKNKFMKLKKDTTASVSIRVDKKLKAKLYKKFKRKLSVQVVPFLEKLCG